jgi:hypothetical protein
MNQPTTEILHDYRGRVIGSVSTTDGDTWTYTHGPDHRPGQRAWPNRTEALSAVWFVTQEQPVELDTITHRDYWDEVDRRDRAARTPDPLNDETRATNEPATMTYDELRSQYPYLSDAPDEALEAYRAAERARTMIKETPMDQQITHGARVAFTHPTDPRDGQTAYVTNVLHGMDGPRAYWLRFDDGSTFKANLAHITAPDTRIDAEFGYIEHGARIFPRLKAAAAACLLALALTGQPASAHTPTDTRPIIGTVAYDAGCTITQAWEDGSALAYCPEDGARYVYDPDGDITTGKQPGWYPLD